jgi:hypothetical protein
MCESRLLVLVLRLLCLSICGRLNDPERWDREFRYNVGRAACRHWQLTRVSAARARRVLTEVCSIVVLKQSTWLVTTLTGSLAESFQDSLAIPALAVAQVLVLQHIPGFFVLLKCSWTPIIRSPVKRIAIYPNLLCFKLTSPPSPQSCQRPPYLFVWPMSSPCSVYW